jgi:hypothetical protein
VSNQRLSLAVAVATILAVPVGIVSIYVAHRDAGISQRDRADGQGSTDDRTAPPGEPGGDATNPSATTSGGRPSPPTDEPAARLPPTGTLVLAPGEGVDVDAAAKVGSRSPEVDLSSNGQGLWVGAEARIISLDSPATSAAECTSGEERAGQGVTFDMALNFQACIVSAGGGVMSLRVYDVTSAGFHLKYQFWR